MPDFDFQVEIDGDLIVVIDRVTRYYAIYTKPSDRPETLAQGGTPHCFDETKANGELSSHRGGLTKRQARRRASLGGLCEPEENPAAHGSRVSLSKGNADSGSQ